MAQALGWFPNNVSLRVLQEVIRVHTVCPQGGTARAGTLRSLCLVAHITPQAQWILTLTEGEGGGGGGAAAADMAAGRRMLKSRVCKSKEVQESGAAMMVGWYGW